MADDYKNGLFICLAVSHTQIQRHHLNIFAQRLECAERSIKELQITENVRTVFGAWAYSIKGNNNLFWKPSISWPLGMRNCTFKKKIAVLISSVQMTSLLTSPKFLHMSFKFTKRDGANKGLHGIQAKIDSKLKVYICRWGASEFLRKCSHKLKSNPEFFL